MGCGNTTNILPPGYELDVIEGQAYANGNKIKCNKIGMT